MLKLSSVEGMFGPPLEGFHRGATCVVTPVTGHEEYVEHGWNGLLTDWDDLRGTARQLDLLARDRELLHFLRTTRSRPRARGPRGSSRASSWPAALLDDPRASRAPPGRRRRARLLADLRGGIEIYGGHLRERAEFARRALRFERRLCVCDTAARPRRRSALRRYRAVKLAARPLRPLTQRRARLLS